MKTTRAESGGGWGGWLCVGKKSNPKMHEQIHMLLIELRRRPYRVECTRSLSTSEVKQHRARLVLGWGTAWEDLRVLSAFLLLQAFEFCSRGSDSAALLLRSVQWGTCCSPGRKQGNDCSLAISSPRLRVQVVFSLPMWVSRP